jgi:hypothetical protein
VIWALAVSSLYILGVWWCYVVVRRLAQDVQEIREIKQTVRTCAIILVWAVTVVIAIVLILYSFVIARELIAFLRDLL